MSLEVSNVAQEVYILQSDDSVQAAKSQFAEDHDVPYGETDGSIISNSGGYPCLCVVIHAP